MTEYINIIPEGTLSLCVFSICVCVCVSVCLCVSGSIQLKFVQFVDISQDKFYNNVTLNV